MIPQGVTNTIYGMGEMQADFNLLSKEYQQSVYNSITRCFSPREIASSQSIGNIIRSLGLQNVKASGVPPEVLRALYYSIERYGHELKSQEFSNAVYGLGLMNLEFEKIPENTLNALGL